MPSALIVTAMYYYVVLLFMYGIYGALTRVISMAGFFPALYLQKKRAAYLEWGACNFSGCCNTQVVGSSNPQELKPPLKSEILSKNSNFNCRAAFCFFAFLRFLSPPRPPDQKRSGSTPFRAGVLAAWPGWQANVVNHN